jgi:hypothetical protein
MLLSPAHLEPRSAQIEPSSTRDFAAWSTNARGDSRPCIACLRRLSNTRYNCLVAAGQFKNPFSSLFLGNVSANERPVFHVRLTRQFHQLMGQQFLLGPRGRHLVDESRNVISELTPPLNESGPTLSPGFARERFAP